MQPQIGIQKPKISQSLLKALTAYHDDNIKDCGKKIIYQFFQKVPTKASDAMKLGIYFEYMCTGYAPNPEDIPVPEKVYVGTSKEKLSADYQKAQSSALLFKEIIKHYGIKINGFAKSLEYNGSTGLIDIFANFNGEDCIIDLKYTALIDDKFSDFGWHTDSLQYKSGLMIQPIHYKYLAANVYGKEYPFYFFIFNSKNEVDAKIIRTNIQQEHIDLHEEVVIAKAKKYIDFYFENPETLEERPNYKRCNSCSYFEICDKKAILPTIEDIYY
jgi:hypothetical protein